MKKAVFALLFVVLLALSHRSFAIDSVLPKNAALKVATMPVEDVRPGMKGVAYTVFEGSKPEPMDVQVLGVMRNTNGPKSNVILVRLQGKKAEYTGVVAGMSGSPVYIDGKLVGALAFRIGEFSKEPIGGVTPIGEMLEINELDRTLPADSQTAASRDRSEVSKTSGPGLPMNLQGDAQPVANYLQPIEAPMVFNGFSQDTLSRFAPQLAAAGITPVMGAGSIDPEAKQPEPLEPGSAVSAILVRGDMGIASTCTVTYVDSDRLLACGHPLLNFGSVDMPMTKAQVLLSLPSPANAFKIVNTTEQVGSFVQDRHTGIMGRFGKEPAMIPVTVTLHGVSRPRAFHFEVLNNAKLTPALMMATVFNALQGMNEYGEDTTYRMQGRINVDGFPAVSLQNMFAPADGGNPAAALAATAVGDRFNRIYSNPYVTPDIKGVELDFDLVRERRLARLEAARTDVTEARPGDDIVIESVLRPYRGERIVRQIPVKIPTSTPKGTLRILVSDGDTLDRLRRMPAALGRRMDLASTIALLNKEHANNRLYISLLEANPEAMVEDKVMPTLPLSVMNVMEPLRGTQDMLVTGESAVNEASTPLDYAVSGAQIITVNVK
jgi:SpoIVB peptidase S55